MSDDGPGTGGVPQGAERAGEGWVPDGLPQLQAGSHTCPEDGACLMEYVSLLAGRRFGDHPGCTDPTLASLARLVNDSCTDAGRPALALLAPALASAPAAGAPGTAAVVRAAVSAACTATGQRAFLVRLRRRAERRYQRVTGSGVRARLARRLDPLYRRGPARIRMEATIAGLHALPPDRRDIALREVLAAAVAVQHCTARPSGSPAPVPAS